MRLIQALVLGIVEGLTEYLPVSSTGHLIVATHALKVDSDAADSFDIVIQAGAILAVLVQYRSLLFTRTVGLFAREKASLQLFTNLLVAFLPAAVAGLLFRKTIKHYLFSPKTVAIAFVVGGVAMIVAPHILKGIKGTAPRTEKLEDMTVGQAAKVGFGQCFALIPGMSRSMSTILAGQFAGLSTPIAAEFSFLIGLPTLGAATVYEGWKARHVLMEQIGVLNLGVGLVTSFLVAWVVIAAFIRYLSQRGLAPFGYYRIVAAAVVWVVLVGF
jgi:undecaprenyl-diphosphatase